MPLWHPFPWSSFLSHTPPILHQCGPVLLRVWHAREGREGEKTDRSFPRFLLLFHRLSWSLGLLLGGSTYPRHTNGAAAPLLIPLSGQAHLD
ncbi:hypothetical protein CSHISOI_02520 [Colletotrichum shisoi]|uniref:Uncharacterized protein n=1 Tax=Colletotrichum shisoi TaxID=2078593 RepID=A0A5Q4C0T9_9PEZI|nr:hypothetical protein CSHISOI_02520 [Colletotrichum shisoi]